MAHPARRPLTLELWPADVIVLFDWLMSVDFGQMPVGHKASKQALADLLTALENKPRAPGPHPGQIERAQHEVSKDMGWQ